MQKLLGLLSDLPNLVSWSKGYAKKTALKRKAEAQNKANVSTFN